MPVPTKHQQSRSFTRSSDRSLARMYSVRAMAAAVTRMATTCICVKPASLSMLKNTPIPPQSAAAIMIKILDFVFKTAPPIQN